MASDTLFVSEKLGSDENNGTEAAPLKSVLAGFIASQGKVLK
jgi:hypothetical protein